MKYIYLFLLLFLIPSVSAVSLNNGVITDKNNFQYSIYQDGMYNISYGDNQSTRLGFGITGKYNGGNISYLSTDFEWGTSLNQTQQGYDVSLRTTNIGFKNAWFTNVSFGDKTKITNRITNIWANPITNGTFYYLLEVGENETPIFYNYNSINMSKNVASNSSPIYVSLNDKFEFNINDILLYGFNLTNITIINASSLGFDSNKRVVAIGFTKGSGTLQSGQSVVIDPEIVASDIEQYSDTSSFSITTTDSYTGSWRIKFDLNCYDWEADGDCYIQNVPAYGIIQKNGINYGTLRSTYTSAGFSEDFTSISINSGDVMSLNFYGGEYWVDATATYMKILFNITGGSNPTYIPTRPNISVVTNGTGYVNQSWVANNTGNITDYYNSSINGGNWVNGSTTTYRNTTGLSSLAWANLTVWAVNSTNATTLSPTALTNETQSQLVYTQVYPIYDSFNASIINETIWNNTNNTWNIINITNGELNLTSNGTGSSFIFTRFQYYMTGNNTRIKVTNHSIDGGFKLSPTYGSGAHWAQWDIYEEPNYYNFHMIADNKVSAQKLNNSTSINMATSPTLNIPYWIQMNVNNTGEIFFDYSQNNITWTNLYHEQWGINSSINIPVYVFLTSYDTSITGKSTIDDFWFSNNLITNYESLAIEFIEDYIIWWE